MIEAQVIDIDDRGLVEATLLMLVLDMEQHHQTLEKIKMRINTLCRRHGIDPDPENHPFKETIEED